MKLNEGKFGRTVNGNKKIQPPLFCADFGDVDMKETNRVRFEPPFVLRALGIR
jgi:hypothetical protein